MRVLYVALTRPKEKLVLVGTVANAEKAAEKWGMICEHDELLLPDGLLAGARNYLDWIGPALIRHPDALPLREHGGSSDSRSIASIQEDPSRWCVHFLSCNGLALAAPAREARDETVMQALYRAEPIYHLHSDYTDEIEARLSWTYPYATAAGYFSKTSVSEMKRRLVSEANQMIVTDDAMSLEDVNKPSLAFRKTILSRPRFMEAKGLTAAERGTLYHTVMQHLPMELAPDSQSVTKWISEMMDQQLLPAFAAKEIDPARIVQFLSSPIAQRIRQSSDVRRELPFSFGIEASEVYAEQDQDIAQETILMQGVLDCIFAEEDGWVLLDYKTDHLRSRQAVAEVKERYRLQINLYARAVERIWQKPVKEAYLYLFDGALLVKM